MAKKPFKMVITYPDPDGGEKLHWKFSYRLDENYIVTSSHLTLEQLACFQELIDGEVSTDAEKRRQAPAHYRAMAFVLMSPEQRRDIQVRELARNALADSDKTEEDSKE